MAEETQATGQPLAEAAAKAVAPDPLTAGLLAKHSAGVRLTPAEYGKLGAFTRLKNRLLGKGVPPVEPAQPGPGAREPAPMATLAQVEAQANGLAPVPVDPMVIKRTTAAILKGGETVAKRAVERAARAAGADPNTVARYGSAAAMPQVTAQLTIDVSPDATQLLAEMLGVEDLRLYPVAAAASALGLYFTNLWLLVDELRAMGERRPAPEPAQPAQATPGQTQPVVLPDPPQPKGAPPVVT